MVAASEQPRVIVKASDYKYPNDSSSSGNNFCPAPASGASVKIQPRTLRPAGLYTTSADYSHMSEKKIFRFDNVAVHNQDALALYGSWATPDVIISDGGYGVSGFRGDAHEPSDLKAWYRPHIEAWSRKAKPGTTLWFWNTEIGWAIVHPLLDENGWDYVCCNVWNKGIQHIAGNCNLPLLKGFPVVTEACVQYVRRPEFYVNGKLLTLKAWLRREWERTELPLYKTNQACEVANAATRKYFTKDHLWYAPPPEVFEKLVAYANEHGASAGKPYFSADGENPMSKGAYEKLFAKFNGKYGVTNVWEQPPLHNGERIRLPGSPKYAHLNQKPLKLIKMLIEVSSDPGDLIWEPFGGLCTAGVASYLTRRAACCAEIDAAVFNIATQRFSRHSAEMFEFENLNNSSREQINANTSV